MIFLLNVCLVARVFATGPVAFDTIDRYQRQTQIPDPHQDPVQRSLIHDGATQYRFAVLLVVQAQAFKPG
jgi:hypothetical protein